MRRPWPNGGLQAPEEEEEKYPELLPLPASFFLYIKSFCKMFTNLQNRAKFSWNKLYFGFKNTETEKNLKLKGV